MNPERTPSERGVQQDLIGIGITCWRTARLCARVISRLDAGEAHRYGNQLRYLETKAIEAMEAAGLRVVSVEGEVFDAGMAVSVINMDDFDPDADLLVDHMVEPIILGPDGVLHPGVVTVRRAHI
jgi:hypothetical protein